MKKGHKMYIVRTFVKARNAKEAIKLYKGLEPDDVFVSEEWKAGEQRNLAEAIGFETEPPEEEEED